MLDRAFSGRAAFKDGMAEEAALRRVACELARG